MGSNIVLPIKVSHLFCNNIMTRQTNSVVRNIFVKMARKTAPSYLEFWWHRQWHNRMLPFVSLGATSRPNRSARLIVYLSVHVKRVNMRPIHVVPELQALLLCGRNSSTLKTRCVVGFARCWRFNEYIVTCWTASRVVCSRPSKQGCCPPLDSSPIEFVIQRLSPPTPALLKCAIIYRWC